MRVCFLVPELRPSGGVAVVAGHARRLSEHSIDADVLLAAEAKAHDGDWDISIGTFWTTWLDLHEVRARRRAMFLQSVEERFYRESELFERLGADAALAQGAHYIVVANWMRDVLAQVRPDARAWFVPNGIDKQRFAGGPGPRRDGPLRVLVEGQPSLWFKGVQDAVAAVRGMREAAELTVVALDPAHGGNLGADRVLGGLDADGMAALYRETDVLVKLSRVESLGLPPLEGFHAGVPCVVTPYTGHEEYVVHGRNGAVVGFDDRDGVTRWLDRLASDRDLLARLSAGARATAHGWPDLAESTHQLAAALRDLAVRPAPDGSQAIARTMRRAIESGREHLRQRAVELDGIRGELEHWRAKAQVVERENQHLYAQVDRLNDHVGELERSRLEVNELLLRSEAELHEVRESRAYRAAVTARRVLRRQQ